MTEKMDRRSRGKELPVTSYPLPVARNHAELETGNWKLETGN